MSRNGCNLVADECKLRLSREHRVGEDLNGEFYRAYVLITSDSGILNFTDHGLQEEKSGTPVRFRLFKNKGSLYAGVEDMLRGAKENGVTKFKLIYGGEKLDNVVENTSVRLGENPRYRERHELDDGVRAHLDSILLNIYSAHTCSKNH